MIIANGTIEVLDGGVVLDDRGNPVATGIDVVETIPCNYRRTSYKGNGSNDGGPYSTASYDIIIGKELRACHLRLLDSRGRCLGEYDVQERGIEVLDSVDAYKLTV